MARSNPAGFVEFGAALSDGSDPDICGSKSLRCTAEICELFLVGAQLGQDPVLIGDLDDVGRIDVFPLDSRRIHF